MENTDVVLLLIGDAQWSIDYFAAPGIHTLFYNFHSWNKNNIIYNKNILAELPYIKY